MITDATIARLHWHAGLQEMEAGVPSISSSTWPEGHVAKDLPLALTDCLQVLATLNHELNGDVPSESGVHAPTVPRVVAYSISEIVRMIRDSHDRAHEEGDRIVLARAAWRVETAWSAVLAGDIDDILEHVELEEAARFGE